MDALGDRHALIIAFLRDLSNREIAYLRGRVLTRFSDNEAMTSPVTNTPDQRRLALVKWVSLLKERGLISSRSNWCAKTKASESGVRAFIKGETDSLNELTYKKLATLPGVSPDELRMPPAITDEEKRKGVELRDKASAFIGRLTMEQLEKALPFLESLVPPPSQDNDED